MNVSECESPTSWALTRFLAQRNNTKYRESFSLLMDVAEDVMVTNMGNSWTEREEQAVQGELKPKEDLH